MHLPVRVEFISGKKKEEFDHLRNSDTQRKEIYEAISHCLDRITEDGFAGIQLQKRLIPIEYRNQNITNLWKMNLRHGWRLLYTLENHNEITVAFIIDWLSHKDYERLFKY